MRLPQVARAWYHAHETTLDQSLHTCVDAAAAPASGQRQKLTDGHQRQPADQLQRLLVGWAETRCFPDGAPPGRCIRHALRHSTSGSVILLAIRRGRIGNIELQFELRPHRAGMLLLGGSPGSLLITPGA